MNFSRLVNDIGVATVAQLRATIADVTAKYMQLAEGMLPPPSPEAEARFKKRVVDAVRAFAVECAEGVDVAPARRQAFSAGITAAALLPLVEVALSTLEREVVARAAEPAERMSLTEMSRGDGE